MPTSTARLDCPHKLTTVLYANRDDRLRSNCRRSSGRLASCRRDARSNRGLPAARGAANYRDVGFPARLSRSLRVASPIGRQRACCLRPRRLTPRRRAAVAASTAAPALRLLQLAEWCSPRGRGRTERLLRLHLWPCAAACRAMTHTMQRSWHDLCDRCGLSCAHAEASASWSWS